jgi:hypothetical protein
MSTPSSDPGQAPQGGQHDEKNDSPLDHAGETADAAMTAYTLGGWGVVDAVTGGYSGMQDSAVGQAVTSGAEEAAGWVGDHAGHIADGAATVATGGLWGAVDAVTGGFSGLQDKAEAVEAAAKEKKAFDDAKKVTQGTGKAGNSDEILDAGARGLRVFEQFLPRLKEWTGKAPDFKGEICKQYDELRHIDFGAFREDAERLTKVHSALLEQNDAMGRAFQASQQTWKGGAADAAGNKVGTYTQGGTAVINDTEKLAGAITPAIDGIQQTVRQYADFVLELGKEVKCAGKTPEEVDDEVRKARGQLNARDLDEIGIDDIFSGAWSVIKDQAIGFILGGGIGSLIGGFVGAKETCDNISKSIVDDAKKFLDTAFKPEIEGKLNQFQQQSTTAQESVQHAYDQLLQAGQVGDDPFKGLQEKGGEQTDRGGSGDGKQGSGQQGSGQQGSGDTPGGGGMPPDGGMPPGGGAPPPMPEPGQPGVPGAPDGPGQQEQVSLGEGNDKVTVQEPKPDGHTQVTVIGEDGKPKTYDVAFPPTGGGPGQPGTVPGQAVPGGGPGQPGTLPAPGQPGVPGQPGGAPIQPGTSGQGAIPVQPGPDGNAVIHEGDRTITLERTPEGEMKVHVDNGAGKPPLDQTIGFGADGASGAPGTGEPKTPNLPPVHTMPAEADPFLGAGQPQPAPGAPNVAPEGPEPAVPGSGAEPVGAGASSGSAGASVGGGAHESGAMGGGSPVGGSPGGASPVGPQDPSVGPASTTPQAAFTTMGTGGGDAPANSFGSASGSLFGGESDQRLAPHDPPPPGGAGGHRHHPAGMDLASMQDGRQASPQGATGMSSMSDAGGQQSGGGQSGAAGAGMMPMGGMGGMGGAQQQGGGEQERTNASPWRTQGQLFDDGVDPSNVRFRSVLGEDRSR